MVIFLRRAHKLKKKKQRRTVIPPASNASSSLDGDTDPPVPLDLPESHNDAEFTMPSDDEFRRMKELCNVCTRFRA